MLRSHLRRADGVVKKFQQKFGCNSSPPRPLHQRRLRAVFITVASTPPRRGGEYCATRFRPRLQRKGLNERGYVFEFPISKTAARRDLLGPPLCKQPGHEHASHTDAASTGVFVAASISHKYGILRIYP